jgi:hypothetical protein
MPFYNNDNLDCYVTSLFVEQYEMNHQEGNKIACSHLTGQMYSAKTLKEWFIEEAKEYGLLPDGNFGVAILNSIDWDQVRLDCIEKLKEIDDDDEFHCDCVECQHSDAKIAGMWLLEKQNNENTDEDINDIIDALSLDLKDHVKAKDAGWMLMSYECFHGNGGEPWINAGSTNQWKPEWREKSVYWTKPL